MCVCACYVSCYLMTHCMCIVCVSDCCGSALQHCVCVLLPFATYEQPVCTHYTELCEAYESHDIHKLEMVASKYEQQFTRVSS